VHARCCNRLQAAGTVTELTGGSRTRRRNGFTSSPGTETARLDAATRAQAGRAAAALAAWRKIGRERFRAEVRRATVVEIPGGHHYVFISHPDRVERAIRDFLARHP
jgi:pimeloyl-ACP methyl ester carboxylesterase